MKKRKKKEDNKVNYGTISLPLPLIEKIKKKIVGTGFSSVSSYVAFILRQILAISEERGKDEIEGVKKRLRALGYLD